MQSLRKLVYLAIGLIVLVVGASIAMSLYEQRTRSQVIDRQFARLAELGVDTTRTPITARPEDRSFYTQLDALAKRIKAVHPDGVGWDGPLPAAEVREKLAPLLVELEALSRDPRVPGLLESPLAPHMNDEVMPLIMALQLQFLTTQAELEASGGRAALPHLYAGLDLATCLNRPGLVWFISSNVSVDNAVRILPDLLGAEDLDFAELRAELEPRLRHASDPRAFETAMGHEAVWLCNLDAEWEDIEIEVDQDLVDVIAEIVRQVELSQKPCGPDSAPLTLIADYGSRLGGVHQTRRRLDVARVALALLTWREARGDWPASLEELGALFEGAVPVDPCSGDVFEYERTSTQVRLAAPGPAAGTHIEAPNDDPGFTWAWPR